MSNFLALEASTEQLVIALYVEQRLWTVAERVSRDKLNRLPELVRSLCQRAECQLSDLDVVAYGMGPGSFTGVRIVAAFAQGLAYGLDAQLLPFSSLQAYAQTAQSKLQLKEVLICNDARMGEMYCGRYIYDAESGLMQSSEPEYLLPAEHVKQLETERAIYFGHEQGIEAEAIARLVERLIRHEPKGLLPATQIKMNYVRNQVTH